MHKTLRACAAITVVLLGLTGCSGWLRPKASPPASFDATTLRWDAATYPAVVLGGGVGGMMAGTYLAMANIKTLLVQGKTPGGLLTQSLSVRNWPGVLDAPGMSIADSMLAQVKAHGVEVGEEEVVGVNFKTWPYTVTLQQCHNASRRRIVKALTVVIAMGASSNYLGILGEQEYWSRGVTNCAVCEGSLYKGKDVCVIGGGNSAIEEAHYLASIARSVTVYVRGNALRATDKRKDEVAALRNVSVIFNTEVTCIKGNGRAVTSIITLDKKTNTHTERPMDGVFLAIGFTPNTALFKDQLDITTQGYIALKRDQQTSVPGVYAIGDICDPVYKQAVTAVGDGCRAALQAQEFLREARYVPSLSTVITDGALTIHPESTTPRQRVSAFAPSIVHDIEDESDFLRLINDSPELVVVDFYATWCGPCRAMAPLYTKLAERFSNVRFAKVNIDVLGRVAGTIGIQGVPTFVFFRNGQEIDRLVGAQSERAFVQRIEQCA